MKFKTLLKLHYIVVATYMYFEKTLWKLEVDACFANELKPH
jgi:hypothetical protein